MTSLRVKGPGRGGSTTISESIFMHCQDGKNIKRRIKPGGEFVEIGTMAWESYIERKIPGPASRSDSSEINIC